MLNRRGFIGALLSLPLVRRLPLAPYLPLGPFGRQPVIGGVEMFFDMEKLRQRAELDEMIAIKTDRWDLYADARVDFDDL